MAASNLDLLVEQGATWAYVLTLKDAASTPVDLTTASAKMQLRKGYGSPVVVELSSTGTISLALSDVETRGIRGGDYIYDLELTQGSTVSRLVQGRVTVSPEVTI
jgi:hypothetical protein